jgi:hypothetical protein
LVIEVFAALPIDREGARDAARRELSKRIYRRAQPSWFERVLRAILNRIGRLLNEASSVVPGGLPGLLLLVVIVVALIVVLRMKLGPVRRRQDLLTDLSGTAPRSAQDYRDEAAAFAAAGDWREALRARFRAVIRQLEERGVLDQRPGRTAGEIAAEAGAAMPSIAASMRAVADVFNEVWYGDRPASEAAYNRVVAVDEAVRGGRQPIAVTR